MDPIAATLCAELQARAAVGMRKYGVSLADANLSRKQVLQHAKELLRRGIRIETVVAGLNMTAAEAAALGAG